MNGLIEQWKSVNATIETVYFNIKYNNIPIVFCNSVGNTNAYYVSTRNINNITTDYFINYGRSAGKDWANTSNENYFYYSKGY